MMNDDLNAMSANHISKETGESIEEFYELDAVEETEADDRFNEINRLNELGNLAVSLKLIGGHGFHGGQYELLHEGKFLLMSPIEAQQFLEQLIAEAEA